MNVDHMLAVYIVFMAGKPCNSDQICIESSDRCGHVDTNIEIVAARFFSILFNFSAANSLVRFTL